MPKDTTVNKLIIVKNANGYSIRPEADHLSGHAGDIIVAENFDNVIARLREQFGDFNNQAEATRTPTLRDFANRMLGNFEEPKTYEELRDELGVMRKEADAKDRALIELRAQNSVLAESLRREQSRFAEMEQIALERGERIEKMATPKAARVRRPAKKKPATKGATLRSK